MGFIALCIGEFAGHIRLKIAKLRFKHEADCVLRLLRHHKTCSCDPHIAICGLQERGLAMTECWSG